MANFAELFCEHHRIAPENYVNEMFRRCLYRRARIFVPIFCVLYPRYFQPDYELIRAVGRLRCTRGLGDEIMNFGSDTRGGWLRRRLKVRLSARRVSHFVYHLLPGEAPICIHTVPPQPRRAQASPSSEPHADVPLTGTPRAA